MVQKEVFTTKEDTAGMKDTTETAAETKERTASTLKPSTPADIAAPAEPRASADAPAPAPTDSSQETQILEAPLDSAPTPMTQPPDAALRLQAD